MEFTLVGTEDGSNITVFVRGQAPQVAHSSHPNFDRIVELVRAGDESALNLFDVAATATTKFERLTERVSTRNGRLYLDNVEVDNSLAKQVCRFISEGVEDWRPLVNFFENVQANPNDHSREQLYTWLEQRDFTITPDGLIVGYKSVYGSDGAYHSTMSGPAIVDGEPFNGLVPNRIGSVIEMPRDDVTHDPRVGCSVGLHVGTYNYAKNYSGSTILEVHVNPRDVVSVPTENEWAKMRVCRYTVVGAIEKPYEEAVRSFVDDQEDFDPQDEELFCPDCQNYWEECDCEGDQLEGEPLGTPDEWKNDGSTDVTVTFGDLVRKALGRDERLCDFCANPVRACNMKRHLRTQHGLS